jgi:hypothetical protein
MAGLRTPADELPTDSELRLIYGLENTASGLLRVSFFTLEDQGIPKRLSVAKKFALVVVEYVPKSIVS